MARYTVSGGFAGFSNPDAGEVTTTDRFNEEYGSEAEAVARARRIAAGLRPGGQVLVNEEPENPWDGFGRGVYCTGLHPDGTPWTTIEYAAAN